MKLDRVTMTGADDSVNATWLIDLSAQYPFVEWGILASRSQMGFSRFPSATWLSSLRRVCDGKDIRLSLHICGRWVRDLLIGEHSLPGGIEDGFQRIQLNFHAEGATCRPKAFHSALRAFGKRQFILQIDGSNGNEHLERLYSENNQLASVDAVPLFDVSGGAGIVPNEWPKPRYLSQCSYHGYAGGLGPDNLTEQLPRIAEAAGDNRVWVDMETRIRSKDDQVFDFDKVARCLEICRPFVV